MVLGPLLTRRLGKGYLQLFPPFIFCFSLSYPSICCCFFASMIPPLRFSIFLIYMIFVIFWEGGLCIFLVRRWDDSCITMGMFNLQHLARCPLEEGDSTGEGFLTVSRLLPLGDNFSVTGRRIFILMTAPSKVEFLVVFWSNTPYSCNYFNPVGWHWLPPTNIFFCPSIYLRARTFSIRVIKRSSFAIQRQSGSLC